MIPFFGVDLTNDKNNTRFNHADLPVIKPSPALTQALESHMKKADTANTRSKLPLPLRIIQWICGASAAMIGIGILRALDTVTLLQGYRNAPGLYWACVICLILWVTLKLAAHYKSKAALETEDAQKTFTDLESVCRSIFRELGVPGRAKELDLMSFYYKVKDGEIKLREKPFQIAQYQLYCCELFTDEENLYIVNLDGKFTIPKTAITSLTTVKKHISFYGWNKETPPNDASFKPYKLTFDNVGGIHAQSYCVLHFDYEGKDWGIHFPCYELPVLEALTGLRPES